MKALLSLLLISSSMLASSVNAGQYTIPLFGSANANTSIGANEYRVIWLNTWLVGQKVISATVTFPKVRTWYPGGTVFVGMVDQQPGGGMQGGNLWWDGIQGVDTFINPTVQNDLLTGVDNYSMPFIYTHLFTLQGLYNDQPVVYSLTADQMAALTTYLRNPNVGYWGFAIDPDVFLIVNGVATMVITTELDNVAPTIDSVSSTPPSPCLCNVGMTRVTLDVSFTDPDLYDYHSAQFVWADGTTTRASASKGKSTASHDYRVPGVYPVQVVITDASGASASSVYTVQILDNTPPVIKGLLTKVVQADANCQAATPDFLSELVVVDCSPVTLSQSLAPGTMVGPGPNEVVVTATDSFGNQTLMPTVFYVTTSPFTTTTLTIAGSPTANTSVRACDYVVYHKQVPLPKGKQIVAARLDFERVWIPNAGTPVFVGLVDQPVKADGAITWLSDGTDLWINPENDNFLSVPTYQPLFTIRGFASWEPVTYDLTPEQIAYLATYMQNDTLGHWGLALDPDSIFGYYGMIRLTITMADEDVPFICPASLEVEADQNGNAAVPDFAQLAAGGCSAAVKSQSPAAGTIVGPGEHTITVNSRNGAECTTILRVLATLPTVDAGGPYSVQEGATVALTASSTTPDLQYAWDLDSDGVFETAGQSVLFSAATLNGPANVNVRVRAWNGRGEALSSTTVSVLNVPPRIDQFQIAPAELNENETATITCQLVDPGYMESLELTINWGDGTTETQAVSAGPACYSHRYLDDGPSGTSSDALDIVVTVKDDNREAAEASGRVTVKNLPPSIDSVTGPASPVPVGSPAALRIDYSDAGTLDTHTAQIAWGDGTSDTLTGEAGKITAEHRYATPGVYVIGVSVADDDSGAATTAYEYVVVYSADAEFVTGGGWVYSPAGAFLPDSAAQGKASFGFVAKYQTGASVPTGNTEFHFNAGNSVFKSTSYDWLVVSGAKAQVKGEGLINRSGPQNGSGTYKFLVTVMDGKIAAGGGTDRFRVRIWSEDSSTKSENVIYDNQPGSVIDELIGPGTELRGGAVSIHK